MSKDTIYRQDFDKFLEDAEKEAVKNRKYVFASALNTIRGNLKIFPSAQPDLQEYSVWFRIGETLVGVSKMHITAEEGIEKIRSYLQRMKKPERKRGKWIRENIVLTSDPPQYQWHCSECGRLVRWFSAEILTDFCPNCGADMRGEKDEL